MLRSLLKTQSVCLMVGTSRRIVPFLSSQNFVNIMAGERQVFRRYMVKWKATRAYDIPNVLGFS